VAKKIAEREGHGIGFAVQGTGLVGIDLDHVIGDDGQLEPWAQEVVEGVDSYTEISPSGDGLRIFAVATIPRALKPSDLGLEMYVSGRYLTVTGERWPGAPGEIAERPDEVMAVFDRYAKDDGDARDATEPPTRGTVSLSDALTTTVLSVASGAVSANAPYNR
jgi:putative DNA primase/helicase